MAATIYALSSAPGRAALSVVRLSGPASGATLARLAGGEIPADRRLRLRRLRDPADGAMIDEALVAAFAEGASYTGETMVEIHLHGGLAVQRRLFAALGAMDDLRLARPGEFSRRAYEAGRLDLAEAEGVAALIDAETEAQRTQALRLYQGALSEAVKRWRRTLIEARALIEAEIDFADEALPEDLASEGRARLAALAAELEAELAGAKAASSIRGGFEAALVGPPNVGKSSLLNALARREAALISEIPGTTRDVIEIRCDVGGRLVVLLDLAGLRRTEDPLEAMGVARARARAESAELRIFVGDGTRWPEMSFWREGDLRVMNKADLGTAPPEGWLAVSARTGVGLEALAEAVGAAAESRTAGASLIVAERHRAALSDAARHLRAAESSDVEIAAEEARLAGRALESVLGVVDVEHLLDDIFGRFCLGK